VILAARGATVGWWRSSESQPKNQFFVMLPIGYLKPSDIIVLTIDLSFLEKRSMTIVNVGGKRAVHGLRPEDIFAKPA
jgi:hypothetical protein